MDSEKVSGGEDRGDSSGEHRRRRRRRRRRSTTEKKTGLSNETAHLLRLARWGVGGLVMAATWAYGFYVIPKLGWGAIIFLPAGPIAMVCVASALAIPVIAMIGVVVGFLYHIDSGPLIGSQRAAMAFVLVGAANAIWQTFVIVVTRRQQQRVMQDETEYR